MPKLTICAFMFDEIWKRIKKETDIQQLKELAKIIGTAQQSVSRKRKEDKFPIEWAYLVGKKYNLSTDWIIEGSGPKRPDESVEDKYMVMLEQWLQRHCSSYSV